MTRWRRLASSLFNGFRIYGVKTPITPEKLVEALLSEEEVSIHQLLEGDIIIVNTEAGDSATQIQDAISKARGQKSSKNQWNFSVTRDMDGNITGMKAEEL